MHVIIPAAGYGTRLYPLTKNKPKALLTVAGKPLLYFSLKKIEKINEEFTGMIKKVVIISNSVYFGVIKEWIEDNKSKINIKIVVLDDGTKTNEDRLGTIGDVVFVIKKENINDDIMILNSDNVFDFSLNRIAGKFNEKKVPCIGLYDVKSLERASRYGIVKTDEKGVIKEFEEKPAKPKSTLASIGIYIYPKDSLKLIEQFYNEKGTEADKSGNLLEWLIGKKSICGVVFDTKWFDIGSKEELDAARKIFNTEDKVLGK